MSTHTEQQQRIDFMQRSPQLFKKFLDFGLAITREGDLDPTLAHLVDIRASQLNGCAFCLDMHVKEAKLHGERELRLHHVAIWRESALFSARERAALAWTETLTHLPSTGVSDAAYAEAREQFSEKELCDLTFRVMAINGWNRINVAFRSVPGSHDRAFGLDKAVLA
jgi:AhpD family alkylhydroperoxidase